MKKETIERVLVKGLGFTFFAEVLDQLVELAEKNAGFQDNVQPYS